MTVYSTSRGLVGLIRYQLEYDQSEFNCVFLGKIHSGCIESHFGNLRKLAGVNYGRVSDKKLLSGLGVRLSGFVTALENYLREWPYVTGYAKRKFLL